jgi:hypothetical protein
LFGSRQYVLAEFSGRMVIEEDAFYEVRENIPCVDYAKVFYPDFVYTGVSDVNRECCRVF